jgi:hypothetical protein
MRRVFCLFATLFLLAVPGADTQGSLDRSREAVDDSLAVDREVADGLAEQAERLRQAARDLMAAPGARATATRRFEAARALDDAADALMSEANRLRATDERLEKALEARAEARRAVRDAVGAVADTAEQGVFAGLADAPDPLPELLGAKARGMDALRRAASLGDRLVPRETLIIGFQLFGDEPTVRDTFLIAVNNTFSSVSDSATVLRSKTGYTEVTGAFPANTDLDTIRTELMNALRVETDDGDLEYLPALLSVSRDWRSGAGATGEPLQTLLTSVIEGGEEAVIAPEGSGD